MDMTRYEKITGREALRRLADGQRVYDSCGWYWEMTETGGVFFVRDGEELPSEVHLTIFSTHKYLYIKKPFDVRQAMRDKPDEWVGAFFDKDSGTWRKVGFDFKNFKAVEAFIKNDVVTDFYDNQVCGALQEELDDCIPLDEVPEDAR